MAIFISKNHLFQTIILGIHVSFRGCVAFKNSIPCPDDPRFVLFCWKLHRKDFWLFAGFSKVVFEVIAGEANQSSETAILVKARRSKGLPPNLRQHAGLGMVVSTLPRIILLDTMDLKHKFVCKIRDSLF